jgi:hypothetical protein
MSKFTFRFGTLKSASVETSAAGNAYVRYAIDAGKFTAYGVAFDEALGRNPRGRKDPRRRLHGHQKGPDRKR